MLFYAFHSDKKEINVPVTASGKYYCPMHCEGEKVYDKAGDCPVCGMDLVKAPELTVNKTLYTCPMHPEVISEIPGSCPICGMDLVPMEPSDSEDQKTYKDLVKKMKVAVVFTVPVFAIAMIEMMPNNPLLKIMDATKWNWVQLILITSCCFLCVLDVLCSCLEINYYLEFEYVYPYRNRNWSCFFIQFSWNVFSRYFSKRI